MKNKPFRFLDSTDSVSELRARLSEAGLDAAADVANDSELRFTCRWLSDTKVTIRWRYHWWPDGINQEDAVVELIVDDEPVASVDVHALLEKQWERPLRNEISDRIVAMASSLTRKPA